LDQQQRQLQEVEQQMIVLRSEKEQLDERIATLKETEQHIKDNIVDLNIEGIQTRKKRKEAEAKLGPAQEDLARVVEQLEGARAELLLKGAELTALKDTLAEQQKEAASVQERVTELQQTLSRTQDALILHGDQLKDIRRCCDDAQRELAELQTAKQSATAALENEQRNLLSVEETLRKEKSSASDAQTQLATLRQELSRLRTEVDTVKISRERDGNKVKTALEQVRVHLSLRRH
jgi:chromosome segregation ATPase